MKIALHYFLTILVYAIFDLAFINLFAKSFISRQVSYHLAEKADIWAALVFYIIFVATLLYFCVYPAWKTQNSLLALCNGALFGLATYGTYELVNKALLKNWTIQMVIVDVIWGVFVAASISYISFWLMRWLRM